jgi:hypothetical protein
MKTRIISGTSMCILGLLIAFGPQFLFKACGVEEGSFPLCHWSIQAEIGMGMLIALLGICLTVLSDPQTRFGITVGIFFASIVALLIPHVVIGGCGMMSMACRRVAFPALSAISIAALLGAAANMVYLEIRATAK